MAENLQGIKIIDVANEIQLNENGLYEFSLPNGRYLIDVRNFPGDMYYWEVYIKFGWCKNTNVGKFFKNVGALHTDSVGGYTSGDTLIESDLIFDSGASNLFSYLYIEIDDYTVSFSVCCVI